MPRPKILSDVDVLETALRIVHDEGPEALTFGRLARASGLSASTLVQRFGGKAELMRATLSQAWDQLDAQTESLAVSMPRTPEGAVAMLVALSGYGGIEAHADGLRVLREDFRDPVLRARGAAWKRVLSAALEARFEGGPEGIGEMLATQWQGRLVWWGFDPQGGVEADVERALRRLIAVLIPSPR
jgi:AcrR family transcriptional regulator